MDKSKSIAPARTPEDPAASRLPDHELMLDAAAHLERTYAEHVQAAHEKAGRTYVEDLRHSSLAAQATLSCELKADDRGL